MSKLSTAVCCILSRRSYGVQAAGAVNVNVNANVNAASTASAPQTGGGAGLAVDGGKARKEVFWMRDPKTGCWIPENRFDAEVDAVELRSRLLCGKNKQ